MIGVVILAVMYILSLAVRIFLFHDDAKDIHRMSYGQIVALMAIRPQAWRVCEWYDRISYSLVYTDHSDPDREYYVTTKTWIEWKRLRLYMRRKEREQHNEWLLGNEGKMIASIQKDIDKFKKEKEGPDDGNKASHMCSAVR